MQKLTIDEELEVTGGIWANVAGAVGGAVGGFYGSILANPNADGWDILKGSFAGAVVGTFSPITGIRNGGIASGATINLLGDVQASLQ